MRVAKGPRPWPIWAFCGLFLFVGILSLLLGLSDLNGWVERLNYNIPGGPWNEDHAIVFLSARFTIVCIPVIAIWGLASVRARLIVAGFTALGWLGLIREMLSFYRYGQLFDFFGTNGIQALATVLLGVGVVCLFLPSAASWLKKKERTDASTFS